MAPFRTKTASLSAPTTPKKRQLVVLATGTRWSPFSKSKEKVGNVWLGKRKRQLSPSLTDVGPATKHLVQESPSPPPAPIPFPALPIVPQPRRPAPLEHAARMPDQAPYRSRNESQLQLWPIVSPTPVRPLSTVPIPLIAGHGREQGHRMRSPSSPTAGSIMRSAAQIPPRNRAVSQSSWVDMECDIPRPRSVPSLHPSKGRGSHEEGAKTLKKTVGTAVDVTLEVLDYATELLTLAPVPGLQEAVDTVLKIAKAAKSVNQNRKECDRLAGRCVAVMLSVRQEVKLAGDHVTEELAVPIRDLVRTFAVVYSFLQGYGHSSTFHKFITRQEASNDLRNCDRSLDDAISMFGMALQIRVMKQMIQMGAQRREVQPTPQFIPLPPSPSPEEQLTPRHKPITKSNNRLVVNHAIIPMDRMPSFATSNAETADLDSIEPSPAPSKHMILEPEDAPSVQELMDDELDPHLRGYGMLTRRDVERWRHQDNAMGSTDTLKRIKLHRPLQKVDHSSSVEPWRHVQLPVVVVNEHDTGRVHTERGKRKRQEVSPRTPSPPRVRNTYPMTGMWASQHTLILPGKDVALLAFQEMGIPVVEPSDIKSHRRPSRPPLLRPKSISYFHGSKAAVGSARLVEKHITVVCTPDLTKLASQRLLVILNGSTVEARPLLARLEWSHRARRGTS